MSDSTTRIDLKSFAKNEYCLYLPNSKLPCGALPQPATQEEPELITLDDYLIDNPARTSVHKVRGDSMKDAGIFDGDLVVVEHNSPTAACDIIVAVVDREFTVKTLRQTGAGTYYLEAANPAFEPIHPTNSLELMGGHSCHQGRDGADSIGIE